MRRNHLADEVREIDGCRMLGHREREGAGQHYIEMGVLADDVEEVFSLLETLLEDTDWVVTNYEDFDGPYFYNPDEGEDAEANIRLKKNTWNEHQV